MAAFVLLAVTTVFAHGLASIVSFGLSVLVIFVMNPLLLIRMRRKYAQVDAVVEDTRPTRIRGRLVAFIDYSFDGIEYTLQETYNEEDCPTIGTRVRVLVNPGRPDDSMSDDGDNTDVLVNIPYVLIFLTIMIVNLIRSRT